MPNETFNFKRGQGKTLLIACGALGREIVDLIEMNRWQHLDVTCLPAKLHHQPSRIPEAIRTKIRANRPAFENIYVLYGDCGTGGELDRVLEEEGGIERIPGPHCFSFFAGNSAFEARADDDMTSFFLTDYFCQHFDKFVWQALGLDRHPDMPQFVFGNYEKLIFMPQTVNPALEVKAKEIAERLELVYEYRFVGYGELASFMALPNTEQRPK